MNAQKPSSSSAQKRVLWEMRQRQSTPGSSRQPSAKPAAPRPIPRSKPTRRTRPVTAGRRNKWGLRIFLFLLLALFIGGGIFGYRILAASNKISVADRSVLGQLKDLLFSQGDTLVGEEEDRINVILIAIGGEGHKGQNLADTIMLMSVRPSDGKIALLSIPRDLYVQVPDEDYYTKINAVHAYGESQREDGGPEMLRRKVEDITGQQVHYFARVDFTAFKEIIDAVGGINITIDNTFFDFWHKISFSAGTEKMDGERALAFARARYVEGPEGGDFKRAARQQQILLALREKVFSVNTALDFTAVNEILNALSDNIRTDMQLWEMKRFYEMARTVDGSSVHSEVLSSGSNGVLVGTTEVLGGAPASVLKPRAGDYSEIKRIATDLLSSEGNMTTVTGGAPKVDDMEETVEPAEDETAVPVEKPDIEIRNGTTVTGLAKRTSDTIEAEGYTVLSIGNATQRDVSETFIYVIDQEYEVGAATLAEFLSVQTKPGLPDGEPKTDAAVLIILGSDSER